METEGEKVYFLSFDDYITGQKAIVNYNLGYFLCPHLSNEGTWVDEGFINGMQSV